MSKCMIISMNLEKPKRSTIWNKGSNKTIKRDIVFEKWLTLSQMLFCLNSLTGFLILAHSFKRSCWAPYTTLAQVVFVNFGAHESRNKTILGTNHAEDKYLE